MEQYLQILAFAAMPALGNFIGGVAAEFMNVSKKVLSLALHMAAGIVLAVVGVELMTRVLQAERSLIVILAFFIGGVVFAIIDKAIGYVQQRFGNGINQKSSSSIWQSTLLFFLTCLAMAL